VRRALGKVAIGFFCSLCFCVPHLNDPYTIARAAGTERKDGERVLASQKTDADADASATAFASIIPVLRHPRCMNCHSSGDFPRQGDDRHPHIMRIRRGPDGHGVNAVKCSSCHQDYNLAGQHMPPGAPDWRLPSPEEPMIWEGLTDRQLCELLVDPKQNGDRTPEQIAEHMHTPLVLWGWNPGEGRTPVPMSSEQFLAEVSRWVSNGAACPKETMKKIH
jgi:hypothetical protein